MDTIFLGSFFPSELNDEIVANSRGALATANSTFQFALLSGLSSYFSSIYSLTLPNIGAFPIRYKKIRFPSKEININVKVGGRSLGFFNLVGAKHLSRFFAAKRALHSRLIKCGGNAVVFIYDLHPPFLVAVSQLKIAFPNIIVCAIVPDLPGFTNGGTSILHSGFLTMEKGLLDRSYAAVDGYVVLSKHMIEKLPVDDRPWTVVEGIFDSEKSEDATVVSQHDDSKSIFYSGSLSRRNGIMRLVEAFQKIPGREYRLVLCGAGDTENEIIEAARADSRIAFRGQIPRSEVLALQKTSTLLVNPRTPEGEFTRYSFPSKTMEYLASDVPLLMHRLEGIPDEYFEHAFVLDSLDVDALRDEIMRICESDPVDLHRRADKAQKFIFQHKNPLVQCKKIAELVTRLIELKR